MTNRILILLLAATLTGCKSQQAVPSVQQNVAEMGSTQAQSQIQKANRSYPTCPSNMRLEMPSTREVAKLGGWELDDDGNLDYEMGDDSLNDVANVTYANAVCVPDHFKP